jgi:hypothetical protein
MKPSDNLLFASVNLPSLDKKLAAQQILEIDKKHMFWDSYRKTNMISLMTKAGKPGYDASDNRTNSGEFHWCDYTPQVIVDWFENIVFPWIGMRTRIMALLTMPGESNGEHIDCDKKELNTFQHKFRIVLQGTTSTLYFITDKGYVRPPDIDGPFIMDGGWPHGMTNSSDEVKITLVLGAPWKGNDIYKSEELMYHLYRDKYTMPDDLEPYWLVKNIPR